ncbi:MAG: glutathione S-transferase family protein [Pseudomonas mandelii]|uniref:Glutathione S-transferase family protein n=1 Tax=Pseudomonas violetae TaxID=2915813 RepID=A0ABT0ESL9_9PSED|nr:MULTISPECIES: glutathione S-transferase family protein [Pseudomonas]KAF0864004.1 glutathione S-transferase family protein [Pseudomonas sp. LD120]MCK1788737.1 glutathione S-transferase family protein [Pseudomonas violetae]
MPILNTNESEVLKLKGLHLYHANISNCSMRVRWLLDEKGLSWTSHEVNLGRQENLEDWYLKINPKGLVPALVDNGVPVTESNDILFYLEKKFPQPYFTPEGQTEQEAMNDWVDLATKIHMKAIKTYVYGTMGAATKKRSDMARYAEIEPDKELVKFHQKALDGFSREDLEAAVDLLKSVFARMEARLKDHEYLVGDRMSLADIAWVPQHVLLSRVGFDFSPYPSIPAWAERFSRRPAYKTAITDWLPKIPMWLMVPVMKLASWWRGHFTS